MPQNPYITFKSTKSNDSNSFRFLGCNFELSSPTSRGDKSQSPLLHTHNCNKNFRMNTMLSLTFNSTLWSMFTQYDYLFKKASPINTGNTYKLWEGTLPCQWAVDYQLQWQRSPRTAVLSVDKIAASPAQSTLHQMWALTERSWRNVTSSLESRHWCWRWGSRCVEICEEWLWAEYPSPQNSSRLSTVI